MSDTSAKGPWAEKTARGSEKLKNRGKRGKLVKKKIAGVDFKTQLEERKHECRAWILEGGSALGVGRGR